MGATKTGHYSNELIRISKIADALSHPARLTILKLLMNGEIVRPIDLSKHLQIHKTSVHSHLKKMQAANLVYYQFQPTEYQVLLNREILGDLHFFIEN